MPKASAIKASFSPADPIETGAGERDSSERYSVPRSAINTAARTIHHKRFRQCPTGRALPEPDSPARPVLFLQSFSCDVLPVFVNDLRGPRKTAFPAVFLFATPKRDLGLTLRFQPLMWPKTTGLPCPVRAPRSFSRCSCVRVADVDRFTRHPAGVPRGERKSSANVPKARTTRPDRAPIPFQSPERFANATVFLSTSAPNTYVSVGRNLFQIRRKPLS